MITRAGVVASALVVVAGLTGCGDAGAAAEGDTDTVALRLVIPDTSIRSPDVPCTGARAFRFAHPGVGYTIDDAEGRQVAAGELPEGVAEEAFTFDMGDSRQPTVCVMTLDVAGVESLDGHVLVIGDRTPVPIIPNVNLDDAPEAVLR